MREEKNRRRTRGNDERTNYRRTRLRTCVSHREHWKNHCIAIIATFHSSCTKSSPHSSSNIMFIVCFASLSNSLSSIFFFTSAIVFPPPPFCESVVCVCVTTNVCVSFFRFSILLFYFMHF